jgi:DNA-binding transcriptional LysR family regulator
MQLPQIIAELNQQYPELDIELVLEDRLVDLVREGIDVAIRITGEAPDSGLVYRRLAPNRQVMCASPAYIEKRGLPRTPADLATHDCVAHSARTTPRLWQLVGPEGEQVSVQINGRPTINSALAVRQAALEGLGIIELNSYLVGDDIVAGRLVRLLPQYRPKGLHIYVPTRCWPASRRNRRGMRSLTFRKEHEQHAPVPRLRKVRRAGRVMHERAGRIVARAVVEGA